LTNELSAVATSLVRSKKLLSLALTAALSTVGPVAGAAADCVLNSLDTLPALSAVEAVGHATDLRLLQTVDADAVRTTFSCSGGYLSELKLQLEPGEQRLINLVADAGVLMPLNLDIDPSGGPASGQWQIVLRALDVNQAGELQPRHFIGDESRLTQLIQIEITADSSNQPGQRQLMRVGGSAKNGSDGVLLVIEDSREERLFQDQFRIDPTLGQFSQRTRAPISPEREPGPVSASSSF